MSNTLQAIKNASVDVIFGKHEEEAIAALMIDHPEFFCSINQYLSPALFTRPEVQYVVAHILNYYEKYGTYPSRGILKDDIMKSLTVDDNFAEDIVVLVDRKSDPREIPAIKARLLDWARKKSYNKLYDPDTIKRFHDGDIEHIHEIIDEASRVREISTAGLWFFNELERLFVIDDSERFTTGIAELDKLIGDGGPARKEMMVVMAPTGRGKSIFLINQAIANVKRGNNVLYLTLELSDEKSGIRGLGALTNLSINKRHEPAIKEQMLRIAKSIKASGAGDLVIYQFPPDQINVDTIAALMDELRKTRSWVPDVVVVDYLELMVSRRNADNDDSYTKQKSCSTQLRGLAINENVVVFTATQTNRAGNDDSAVIDVTKIAESYGKSMAMDYLVSINQSDEERNEKPASHARLYIAKNRNGEDRQTIPIKLNYDTMAIREIMQ